MQRIKIIDKEAPKQLQKLFKKQRFILTGDPANNQFSNPLREVVLENALDAVIAMDSQNIIIDWNKQAEITFGWRKDEVLGKILADVVIPQEFRKAHHEGLEKFLKTGIGPILNSRIEVLAVKRNGNKFPVELTIIPVILNGSYIFYSFLRDISDKKLAEKELLLRSEALEMSEELYHSTFAKAPVGILNTGPDGKLINVNDKFCEMLGYSREELKNLTFLKLTHADDQEIDQRMFKELKESKLKVYDREKRYIRKDGSSLWVHVTGQMLYYADGRPKHSVTIVQDISSRKIAEEKKAILEARLRLLSELSRDLLEEPLGYDERLQKFVRAAVPEIAHWCAVDIVDENGDIKLAAVAHMDPTKVELAYEMRKRFPQDERKTGPFHVVETRKPELVSNIDSAILKMIAVNDDHYEIIKNLGIKSYVCVPIIAHGNVLGAFTMVSERMNYDESDLSFAEDLATRAALALYNSKLYSSAKEAIQARDEFLSIASHELKTPLTTLKIQAQIQARLQHKGSSDAYSKERIDANTEKSVRMVNRLERLVDDMLDISRIRTGKLTVNKEMANLVSVVNEVIDRLQGQFIAATGDKIKFDSPPEAKCQIDVMRIEQVITNLLQNALKYGLGKNVAVIINDASDFVLLSVTDEGMGISEENQLKIFERFERVVNPNEISGLGLGLYISQQIVKAHNGKIWVSSKLGKGSSFNVWLPKNYPNKVL